MFVMFHISTFRSGFQRQMQLKFYSFYLRFTLKTIETTMISVSGLTKSYANNIAVDKLSFAVQRGEVVGFLGPNGAGKTTTMKMIAGFLTPDSGKIRINDIDMIDNPVRAKSQLGYLPEGMPLYQDMPVHAFLAFIARIRGLEGKSWCKV